MNKYSKLTDSLLNKAVIKRLKTLEAPLRAEDIFSKSRGDAMSLLHYMRGTGIFCCITISSDYDYSWDMSAIISEMHDVAHTPHASICSEDFNRGICILFLISFDAYDKLRKGKKK
jgi:hypothetical protein